jgi:hypothetical protein
MTPQELERIGIAITGSTDWIAPLAKLMGFRRSVVVRTWWIGKTKITAPKQRKLFLLAGQPDTPLCPVSDKTRLRLERIMAMREQEYTYESIGQQMGISCQAVVDLVTRYRLVKPSELQCPVCSVMFRPWNGKQRCCSKRCGQIRWRSLHRDLGPRDPKLCLECATSFPPRDARSKYCSRRCRNGHRARHYRRGVRAKAGA